MTVSAHIGPLTYNGNGTTLAFTYTWKAFDEDDLAVYLVDSDGVETLQTIATHYTVDGVGEDSGGNVNMLTAPATGEQLIIDKALAITQETDYVENDPFPADAHEEALDKLTIITQMLSDQVDRCPKVTRASGVTDIEMAEPEAGKLLAWNNDEDGIVNTDGVTATGLTVSVYGATLIDDATAGDARTTLGAASSAEVTTIEGLISGENILINGDFRVAQRGTSFTSATTPANSDDTYLLDRWILLSDGNDIVDVTQDATDLPAGFMTKMLLDVETADKKFGILQVVENKDVAPIYANVASLSFWAKVTGTSISKIRAAVLGWSGTVDTVTSDVVTAWAAAGTNPTLAASWTNKNTPSDLALTTAWQQFTIENVSIGSANNIAVFIWVDDITLTIGDFLHIAGVKLEAGERATAWRHRPYQYELALCQRYYEVMGGGSTLFPRATGYNGTSEYDISSLPFKVTKRKIPTIAKTGTWAVSNCGQPAFGNASVDGMTMAAQVTSVGAYSFYPDGTDDKVTMDAEL